MTRYFFKETFQHIIIPSIIVCFVVLISCEGKRDINYENSVIDSVINRLDNENDENVSINESESTVDSMDITVQDETQQSIKEDEFIDDPSGTYIYERAGSMGGNIVLRITGNTWISKLTMNTGFGEAYDEEQAMYSSGYVDGNILLDETGYVQVGKLWKNANKRWAVDFAGSSGEVTMFKQ